MTTKATIHSLSPAAADPEQAHRVRLAGAWALAVALVVAIGAYGFDYYSLGAVDRPLSPKHALLRPSGAIGIKLGMLGVGMFLLIYLYYFRKRWGWLASIGKTKHWLDFHIVLGVTAPIIIAFHAAFKFRGIAGMAFWIMLAVALSGIVGRYLYAQIPRHLNAAEYSWQELQDEQLTLTHQMAQQKIFAPGELVAAFHVPDVEMVKHKSAMGALLWMFMLDVARPFRVVSLRRRVLGFGAVVLSLGGLLPSGNADLEQVVRAVRRQAALSKRMVFLSRTQQVFQLWHVVHRPFSYAFVVLALLHIVTAMLLGYLYDNISAMNNLVAFVIAAAVLLFFMSRYLKDMRKQQIEAREATEKGKLRSDGPHAQHPHIDAAHCIGCAACTAVCPEGDVLAMVGGKAAIVNGYKCIGHSLCAEVCPVGAITMVMASPSMGADMPRLTSGYETSIQNLFVAGELGGLALIKNAIMQGRNCVDTIASRISPTHAGGAVSDIYDVLIVGAGPAGISASLRAIERKLNHITLDEGELGGTVAKYPRQKLVMTSPVEFPMYGKFKKTELSKEDLIAFWNKVLERVDFNFRKGEKVEDIRKGDDGVFAVTTARSQYRARAVVLALGRTGAPRKLGVKGEELPKVMYRLIEADHYINKQILIVGGGDSAIEASMGLAHQVGNKVTLSYRKESFTRIKERNSRRIADCIRQGKLEVVFNSVPVEFKPRAVVLDVNGSPREIPNDFAWIFAGGEPPSAFLKKIGVEFGIRDMTSEASTEVRQSKTQAPGIGSPTLVAR